jgi:formiminoglutamase
MTTIDHFSSTTRPAEELFYQRGDPNDRRLGEIVGCEQAQYDAAQIVILGCPQDEGVQRNGGRPGAATAPDEIRRCLYKLAWNSPESTLFDLGNTQIQSTLEDTHALHQQVVENVLHNGKILIVLGGGNDLSYPDCAGLAALYPDPLALNIDAHFDVRADDPRNSGTPYRQLLEENLLLAERFYEMGSQPQANSQVYKNYLAEKGVRVHDLESLRRAGISTMFRAILNESDSEAIFWGFDMDSVRASDAPGVSAPSPIGLTGEEFCKIAAIAGEDSRSKILEITEVNPRYDIDARTSRLAAIAIWHFLIERISP